MTKPETDAEFLERMWSTESPLGQVKAGDVVRLLRLAERGAKIPDEPTKAMLNAELGLRPWDNLPSYESRRDLRPYIYRAMLTTALKDTDKCGLMYQEHQAPGGGA